MKLLILAVFCIVFCRSFPTLGGYQQVDIATAEQDPEVQAIIDAGLQKVIDDGLQKGELSSTDFELTKINSVEKQVSSGTNNYKINCEFANDEDVAITANFDISYQGSSSQEIAIDYSYTVTKVNIVTRVEQAYVEVPSAEVQYSSEVQSIINFGVNEVIQAGISGKNIPNTSYKISKIVSVSRQVKETALFYKCSVQLESNEGTTLDMTFTVYYQPLQDVKTVVDYSYKIESQEHENTEVAVTTTIIAPIEDQYLPVPERELENDDAVKDVLDYGCKQITNIAISEKKIPDVVLEIKTVIQAESQVVGNGIFYKFTCTLSHGDDVTVTAVITIYIDVYTKEKTLTDYSYQCEVKQDNSNQEQNQEEGGFVESEFDIIVPPQEQPELEGEIEPVQEQEDTIADEEQGWIFGQTFPVYNQEEEHVIVVVEQPETNQQTNEEQVFIYEPEEDTQIEPVPIVHEEEEQQVYVPEIHEEEQIIVNPPEIYEEEQIIQPEQHPQEDGYVQISVEQLQSDDEASSVFQFGMDTVIKQGIADDKIPKDEYTVNKITNASKRSGDSGNLYKFSCEVTGSKENLVLVLSFTVYYQFSSHRRTLSSFSYDIKTTETTTTTDTKPVISIEGDYVPCTPEEIQSDEAIQNVLDYGATQVYVTGIQEGKVPVSQFSIKVVVSVYKQVIVNGGSYKCEVVLENKDNITITAHFTVSYQSSTKECTMISYSYNVNNEDTETNNTTMETDENTETTETPIVDDSYKELSLSEIQNSDEAKGVLKYAIIAVIKKGYSANKIPVSSYTTTKIVSMSRKRQEDGVNYYKCEVELEDHNEVHLEINYTASIKVSTQAKTLWSWSYDVSNIKTTTTTTEENVASTGYTQVENEEIDHNAEIQSCIKYGVEQVIPDGRDYSLSKINSVYRQVIKSAFYYKFDIELTQENKVAYLTCTVKYNPEFSQKDVIAYSYKTKTMTRTSSTSSSSSSSSSSSWWSSSTSWSSSSSSSSSHSSSSSSSSSSSTHKSFSSYKYKKISVSTVESSSKYQDILNYGVNRCVQDLQDNRVIASSDFQISDVLEAYTQEAGDYENCKLKVTLTNSGGVSLDIDFNVQYEASTDAKSLTSYSVEGTSAGQDQVLIADYQGEKDGQLEIGNCERIIPAEIEVNNDIQGAINYGAEEVKKNVAEKEDMDTSSYSIKEVKNVYREVVHDSNYRVDAILENDEGSTIDCSYSVNYQPSTDTKDLVSYSYITY